MAALPPPSSSSTSTPLSSSSTISKQRTNYTRLCRLLTNIGTRVLRDVFDSLQPPAGLQKHLNSITVRSQLTSLRTKRILYTQQWDKLYPATGVPLSTSFDITLLFLLLRNTCGLHPPATGWDAAPLPSDSSREADLIRVKRCRNEITAHSSQAELSDVDFETHWAEIEEALIRLGGKQCEPDIHRLKIESMDPENEAHLSVLLRSWEEGEEKKLDAIRQELNQLSANLPCEGNQQQNPFCVLPQKPSHDTINRTSEVTEVIDEIQRLRTAFPDEITVTYLSGNPGCGKSEVARQIGWKYYNEIAKDESTKFVTTLNASDLDTLTESYLDLVYQLRCNNTSSIMNTFNNQEQKLSHLQRLVAPELQNYTRWLMIIDNVEDLQLISRFISHAGQNGKGHILITTQDSRSIPLSDSLSHHMSLSDGMRPDDAVKSLCAISRFPDENGMVLLVAKELDFQPLALACAAVYMQRVRIADPTMNWKIYLEDLKKGNRESTEREFERMSHSYGKSMTTAVTMAIKNENKKSKVMCRAFEFFSVMAPEFISLEHVVNYVMKCMPDVNKHFVATEIMSSSLVLTSEYKGKPMVRVHQVVLHVLQSINKQKYNKNENVWDYLTRVFDIFSYFGINSKKETYWACLTRVLDVFSYLDTMDEQSIDYITSARQLIVHFVHMSCEIKGLELFNQSDLPVITLIRLARLFDSVGKYVEAKDCYERLLAIVKSLCGTNSAEVGGILYRLGSVLTSLGKYKEAEECYSKTLAIEVKMYGSNDIRLTSILNNLGLALREVGRYSEAKEYYEKALAKNPSSATLGNLGLVLSDLGECRKSKECIEKAIDIHARDYGNNHPHAMFAHLSNLGIALRNLGRYSESKDYSKKALTVLETAFEKDHPDFGIGQYLLGLSLQELGQHNDAQLCFEKSVQILEASYGKDHSRLARTLNGLGRLQQEQGDYQAAKLNLDRALAININSFGEKHPQVAVTLNNLGRVFQSLKEYEQAKEYFKRALVINEETLPANHPEIAITLNNLGQVLIKLEQDEEGNCCLERAVVIKEKNPDFAFKF